MKKILVIQNKRIGDVLIASVIAENMKIVYPDSHIDYLVYDYTTGVIENNPYIDQIIPINEKELKKLPKLFHLIREVRKNNYDIIIDPYGKLQSKLICLFSSVKQRVGFKPPHKKFFFKFYTHPVQPITEKSKPCGIAIEDRVHLCSSVFSIDDDDIIYEPKIHLTEQEQSYDKLNTYDKPVIMFGVLGSTPQKSMPYEYIARLVDHVTTNYDAYILFNYAPHQKDDALEIYNMCSNKEQIIMDIYEDDIRGFIKLMNKCSLLIANEGGIVHISKALDKPTFTIFSPYVLRKHWGSFEDGVKHTSVHLLDHKPDLFETHRENRRKIEDDPQFFYKQLTPELIIPKLDTFLKHQLTQ